MKYDGSSTVLLGTTALREMKMKRSLGRMMMSFANRTTVLSRIGKGVILIYDFTEAKLWELVGFDRSVIPVYQLCYIVICR